MRPDGKVISTFESAFFGAAFSCGKSSIWSENMDDKTIQAVADATTEVARTGGKVVDAGTKFGGFVGDLIVEPLRERVGIWTDNL